ncbi:MAG: MFS transporter, partial [Chloroflexi bacterium]|nr:MFS transporter [Chloroflexota bacterium]
KEVWTLFAFTLLTGVAWSFNMPVRQALVPVLVPKEDLLNAFALNSAGFNLTRIVGPTLGGLLIAWFGASNNFLLQAIVYFGVIVMVMQMRVPPPAPAKANRSVGGDLAEGLRYVWADKTVLTLMLLALIPMVFSMPYVSLMPVFAKDVLSVGPEGLGLLMAAPGLGALAGTLTLASLGNFKRKGLLLITAITLLGIFLVLFSQSPSLPMAMFFLVGVGACQIAFMATNNTLLQTIIPDALRGRVMSIYMLDQGLMPLGSMFAGVMASGMGAPFAVTVMGSFVLLLAVLSGVLIPRIRRME